MGWISGLRTGSLMRSIVCCQEALCCLRTAAASDMVTSGDEPPRSPRECLERGKGQQGTSGLLSNPHWRRSRLHAQRKRDLRVSKSTHRRAHLHKTRLAGRNEGNADGLNAVERPTMERPTTLARRTMVACYSRGTSLRSSLARKGR